MIADELGEAADLYRGSQPASTWTVLQTVSLPLLHSLQSLLIFGAVKGRDRDLRRLALITLNRDFDELDETLTNRLR